MTSIFPEIFAPPSIAMKGRFGSESACPRYSSSFAISKPATAGRSTCATPTVEACARCAAPKASLTIQVAELSPGRAIGVRRCSLPRQEARILEQQNIPGCQGVCRLHRLVRVRRLEEAHRGTEQLRQPRRGRIERILGIRLALGAAQVRYQHNGRTKLAQQLDRGQRRTDSSVVRDAALGVERDVEVDADECALATDFARREVPHRPLACQLTQPRRSLSSPVAFGARAPRRTPRRG